MNIFWKKRKLELKETFSISYGNYSYREALCIKLSYKGASGYGECVAIDYYHINLDSFILKLKETQNKIEAAPILDPFAFHAFLLTLNLHSFLVSALDCAFWDLFGKLENKSFAEINLMDTSCMPQSSITISIGEPEKQVEKILRSEWPKFKVKCNSYKEEHILKLLETEKHLALDSNASFSEADCLILQANPLSEKFIYIEQPMPPEKYGILSKTGFANWMADEDCLHPEDLPKLKEHYRSTNIKLMKCGGLTPALEMIRQARAFGFEIMVGCMTESSVGISAGIALASLCDFADLDGANLVANDYAKGSFVEKGNLILSDKPGLGIEIIS